MKNFLLFIFLFLSIYASAQKIIINPDLIVSRTDFDISEPGSTYIEKANMIIDEITKDKVDVYVIVRGYAHWGLNISISKDSIIPEYYHWNDGGGHTTRLKFDTFELTLNARNYKIGDRLVGKFKGVVAETDRDGNVKKRSLKGKFIHIIENSNEKLKKQSDQEQADLSRKTYRETALYYRMDLNTGLELKALTYQLANSDDEYYLYSSSRDWVTGMNNFSKASAEADVKKPGTIILKLKLEQPESEYWQNFTKSTEHYGLIIDDTLWHIGDGLTIKNGYAIFPLKIKKEKANELVSRLNIAIQKHKKSQKTMQYMQKHPE